MLYRRPAAALGDLLIRRALRDRGRALAVPDAAIEAARDRGLLGAGERVALFNCAAGHKYPLPAAATA